VEATPLYGVEYFFAYSAFLVTHHPSLVTLKWLDPGVPKKAAGKTNFNAEHPSSVVPQCGTEGGRKGRRETQGKNPLRISAFLRGLCV